MAEESLTTNEKHPVVRIGNTVHRPTEWWTPAIHALLKHLEAVGFPYSPRVLGFDDEGREVLSYLQGESGKEGWAKIVPDEGLKAFARLLRRYHDAVADFKPDQSLKWSSGTKDLKPGEIICHGDFGPWNITWNGNVPVGLIDWDMARPAKPQYDILYGLEYSAPFRDDKQALKWQAFTEIPDRKRRIAVFLDAYGTDRISDIAAKVADTQRTTGKHEAYLAGKGVQPQADWVSNGDLDEIEKRAKWTEANGYLFE